ncbi:hypothetical protein ACLF30_000191 [Cronobacter sakazakii]|uniref:hypothetical protein n=1 Tax=Cronobacter sakazakii TaxID=28141 RepID=UPI00277CCD55|nr:hypothetical protein [Cronobacter sakazakii]EKY2044659.1 hypothetical protein [Cronobacter sakazakii]EKY2084344.1 hypothetical protein [Cronobacter sakazakii]ELY4577705.1 hypothetical protein [Cronobacter sakazakii]
MNTAKLKAAAEKAKEYGGIAMYSKAIKANAAFKEAANPAAVLELIAALEAAEKRNAELEANQITATGTQILSEAIGAHAYIAGCLVQGRPDLALEEAQKWVSVFSGVAAGINLETGGGREA